jgi:hypothetical protein
VKLIEIAIDIGIDNLGRVGWTSETTRVSRKLYKLALTSERDFGIWQQSVLRNISCIPAIAYFSN